MTFALLPAEATFSLQLHTPGRRQTHSFPCYYLFKENSKRYKVLKSFSFDVSTAISPPSHKDLADKFLQAPECLAHKFIDQLGAQ